MNVKLNTILRIALVLAVFALPGVAWGQTSVDGDASAEVQEIPLSLTQDNALSFGTFMPFGRPGTVTISEINQHSFTDVHIITEGQRADWTISGVPGAFFAKTISTSTTLSNGTDTMDVTDIVNVTNPTVLNGVGGGGIGIGATLNVNANQPPGIYSGTYNITIAYN